MNGYTDPQHGAPEPGQQPPPPLQHRPRPSMDEALQHTPLTSINPFNPDIIPIPSVGTTSSFPPLLSDAERHESHRVLRSLDQEASSIYHTSARLEQALNDLRHLLKPDDLTAYKFPPTTSPRRPEQPSAIPLAHVNGLNNSSQPTPIGRFATMLLNSTNVSFSNRYPTPVSPAPAAPEQRSPKRTSKIKRSRSPPQTPNNIKIEDPTDSIAARDHTQTPVVVIPPCSSDRSEYHAFPDMDARILLDSEARSKNRKRDTEDIEGKLREMSGDQRERAAVALQHLQEVLFATFEAEDRLEPDTSGSHQAHDGDYFAPSSHGEAQFLLTSAALSRLDSTIAKVISAKRFREVSAEYLSRLQKLCHKVILQSAETDPTPPASDETVAEWTMTLESVDSSLLASRALLRIMTAGRDEKELYSEEVLADLLAVLKQNLEALLMPIVEWKTLDKPALPRLDTQTRTLLTNITGRVGRVLKLFGDLLLHVDLSDTAMTTVEDLSVKLVFVANASSDKDSILGVQKFETLRRNAMDVLARIFLKNPGQRDSILDEILSSLEKLPASRQSARHYKVMDGRPIQLVSALLMQLIQTAATRLPEKRGRPTISDEPAESDKDPEDEKRRDLGTTYKANGHGTLTSLVEAGKPLLTTVQMNAAHVSRYLVARALKSSKTGDEPYRNLLDIFTEDFVNVLGSTDWPAAELLLEELLRRFVVIMDNEKSVAPAKNMALDLMGVMGSGIADLRHGLEKACRAAETDSTQMAQHLIQLSHNYLEGERIDFEILEVNGPYRCVIEYLDCRAEDDIQIQNARNYLLLRWASQVWTSAELDESTQPPREGVVHLLDAGIRDGASLSRTSDFGKVPTVLGRLSYILVVINSTFCRASLRIFSTLVQSISSQHATVRSRGLKSVISLLEKDPSMLTSNKNMLKHILRASTDASTMVRDSALGLIGRIIALKPDLEEQCLESLIERSADPTTGIRKRTINLLKSIYVRNGQGHIRVEIALALLQRMTDHEDTIVELARQILEEIWIQPFISISGLQDPPLQAQQELHAHAVQLIAVADCSETVLNSFEPLFHSLLMPSCKNVEANRQVCKAIVCGLFDAFIENDQRNGKKSRKNVLAFLAIFAQAGHFIFDVNQLKMLQVYTENLKTREDLVVYSPVARIYSATLPSLPPTQRDFVLAIQQNLINSIPLINIPELLDQVTQCLWALNGALQNTQKIVRVFLNVLQGIQKSKDNDTGRVAKLLPMAGYLAKNWSVDAHLKTFQDTFTWWKGDSVSDLVVNLLSTFTKPDRAANVQQAALESICLTCQTWPKNYVKKEVSTILESIFRGGNRRLQAIAISGFRDFFGVEEARSKKVANADETKNVANSSERLGQSMVLSDNDGAATFLAQKFLDDILRLALASADDMAVTATELITSTNRQGLVHPRASGHVLVALETSPNKRIAKMAYEEHLSLNAKHESILEKEYLRAIEQSFHYQRDTILDSSGLVEFRTPKLALFFEVLKQGSITMRKKLLVNLCKQINFNPSKLSIAELEEHYMYARYVCQNIALTDHSRLDEILAITSTLETIFAATGNTLSQQIESFNDACPPSTESISPEALAAMHKLALSSTTLTLLWHTRSHLRSVTTNLPTSAHSTSNKPNGAAKPPKASVKDTNKQPLKPTNAAQLTETYLQRIELIGAFASEQPMRKQLAAFMELHSVDVDAKIGADDDDDADMDDTVAGARLETPSVDGSLGPADGVSVSGGSGANGGAGGGKRKRSSVGGGSKAGTPSKTGRPRGRPSLEKRKSSSNVGKKWEDDDGGWD